MKNFVQALKAHLREAGRTAISSTEERWDFNGEESILTCIEEVDFDKLCAEIDKFSEQFTKKSDPA